MKNDQNIEAVELENVNVENVNLPTFTNVDWSKIEKAKETRSLNFEYLKMEAGQVGRFIFTGIFEQLVNERKTLLAGLYSKDQAFISASHMIVQACQKVSPGTILEIIYKGDKNLGGGKKLGEYEVNQVIL